MAKRLPLRHVIVALLALLVVAAVIAAYVATRAYWRPSVDEAAFLAAYEQDDREKVVQLYELALTDRDEATPGSERQSQGEQIANAIEARIATDAVLRYERVFQGGTLTADDLSFFSDYERFSQHALLSRFVDYAYAYLRGHHDDAEMLHMLKESLQIDAVYQVYGRVGLEFAQMSEAKPKIAEAELAVQEERWLDAVNAWDELAGDRAMSHFTQAFIEDQWLDAKAKLLAESTTAIETLIGRRRYFSAREYLDLVLPIFPYDDALLNMNKEIDGHLPQSYQLWEYAVDYIAVRPLIADAERAFANLRYLEATDHYLLLGNEFKAMLQALYENNYVLVSDDLFLSGDGKFYSFKVPEGKKPLVLVLDSFHLSPVRSASGTVDRLVLDGDRVVGAFVDEYEQPVLAEDGDAISILEAFVAEHPDFSFNGAKGTIAITGQYGLFGYVLNPTQALYKNELRIENGMMPITYDTSKIEAETAQASAVAARLLADGWRFASNTYGDINVPDTNYEALLADIEMWQSVLVPIIGDVDTFVYPRGAYMIDAKAKKDALAAAGYSRLLGHGRSAYFTYGSGYAHIDMNFIGGNALRNPNDTNIARFFDTSQILDTERRPAP